MIRFFTFQQYHGKRDVGSTRLRVTNLLKYWPEAHLYQYGDNPEVLIFQKVYVQADYKFIENFKGIKILDICDPDWLDNQNVKQTLDAVDGVTCPTEALAEFMRQLTDKPVKVIPDRHDVEGIAEPLPHKGTATRAVWFGYKQNAQLLQFAVPSIEKEGMTLTIISNDDPQAYRWAHDPEAFMSKYKFKKYDPETIVADLKACDICVLPPGTRPQDRFKSNNKTTQCWLAGIPVANDGDEMRRLIDPDIRNEEVQTNYKIALEDYDVRKSIIELKAFIKELRDAHI